MRKLAFLIALLIPLAGFGRVGITKQGNMIKFTGLYKSETTLAGINNGTIYIGSINSVSVQGDQIVFRQNNVPVIWVAYSDITSKLSTSTPTAYVEKLILLDYFSVPVAIDVDPLPVEVDTVYGQVQVKGITNKINVDSVYKQIQIKGITSKVNVDSISRQVQVKGITNTIVVDSTKTRGYTKINNVVDIDSLTTRKHVKVDSLYGQVQVKGITESIVVDSTKTRGSVSINNLVDIDSTMTRKVIRVDSLWGQVQVKGITTAIVVDSTKTRGFVGISNVVHIDSTTTRRHIKVDSVYGQVEIKGYPSIVYAASDTIDIAGGDTTLIYEPSIGSRPWSVQALAVESIDSPVTITLYGSNDGVNYEELDTQLTGTITGTNNIAFAGTEISFTYFQIGITVGSATVGKLKFYTIL